MMSEAPPEGIKHIVTIKQVEKPVKITDQAKAELQSSGMMDEKGKLKLKGVSPKMLKRMKLEAVDCPVLDREIGFLQCYVCRNFFSRPMGKVFCKGDPLQAYRGLFKDDLTIYRDYKLFTNLLQGHIKEGDISKNTLF